jgi:hypothetical protein
VQEVHGRLQLNEKAVKTQWRDFSRVSVEGDSSKGHFEPGGDSSARISTNVIWLGARDRY